MFVIFCAGRIPITFPFPPATEVMQTPPQGILPPVYSSIDAYDNADLRTVQFVLLDQVVGVETVAVDSHGHLGVVDRHGKVMLIRL